MRVFGTIDAETGVMPLLRGDDSPRCIPVRPAYLTALKQ